MGAQGLQEVDAVRAQDQILALEVLERLYYHYNNFKH